MGRKRARKSARKSAHKQPNQSSLWEGSTAQRYHQDEIDLQIVASIDYKLLADSWERAMAINDGILKHVGILLHSFFGLSISQDEVDQRASNLEKHFSDKWHDIRRQGSDALIRLSDSARRQVTDILESLRLKMLASELSSDRRLTRGGSRRHLTGAKNGITALPLAQIKHRQRREKRKHKTRRQSVQKVGDGDTVACQPESVRSPDMALVVEDCSETGSTRLDPDAMNATRRNESVKTFSYLNDSSESKEAGQKQFSAPNRAKLRLCQLIQTPHMGINAACSLEGIVSQQEDESLKAQLQHVLHFFTEETSLLKNRNKKLERYLKDLKQRHATICDEYNTFLQARHLGDSTAQIKQIADLRRAYTIAEDELREERERYPFFKSTSLVEGQDIDRKIKELASIFKAKASLLLSNDDSPLEDEDLKHLQEGTPGLLIQHALGQSSMHFVPSLLRTQVDAGISLASVVRSLLCAANFLWIFDVSFHPLLEGYNSILENYRELISRRHGDNSLRCIDFLAHKEWLESDSFREGSMSFQIDMLAKTFHDCLKPLFGRRCGTVDVEKTDGSQLWFQQIERIRDVFESALELKIQILLSPHLFEMKMFEPTSAYDQNSMQPEDRDPDQLRESRSQQLAVKLCLHPVLIAWEYEKRMFDYAGFVGSGDQRRAACINHKIISRARVLLQKRDNQMTVYDSEDEMVVEQK